jgi:starch phosphorylase
VESIQELRARLNELACNLFWTWHVEVRDIFRDLHPTLWKEKSYNPLSFLDSLSDEYLTDRIKIMALRSRITRAHYVLRDYLDDPDTWGHHHVRSLRVRPVAYFSAEFGLHESLRIYSGGLGVLAGDHLKAASDLDVPLIGVGMLYAKGYFNQTLNGEGWQQEHYFDADVARLPLELAHGPDGQPLRVVVTTNHEDAIHVQVWTARVGRCHLLLLDTNVDENTEENRELTAQLYGGDSRVRIRQELVLGVGGMRALHGMGIHPGVIHMNEGHSAFALLEMARHVMNRDGRSFNDIREIVASMSVFTTHTPVPAGHDRFDAGLVEDTLDTLREALGLSTKELLALGRTNPGDDNETFCMTVLGLKMSRRRNAVSSLHRRVSKSMWHSIWPDKPIEDVPIGHITNGIHVGTWLAPEMDRLYRRWLGEEWRHRMFDPDVWEPIDEMYDEELWEQSEILRGRLIDFARERSRQQNAARGEKDPTADPDKPFLSPSVLTIGVARRFAPYKRSDLLLRDEERLDRLINKPGRPVQIIFAGKAHPKDDEGKKLIQRIFKAARDPRFLGKIVFLENYDFNVTRQLVHGVDVWLNTPRRPLEACGTSGMKAVLNGALNLSILDGWWAEAYDGSNGFAIGRGGEHADWQHQDQDDLGALYHVLENEVVPMFYDRDEDGVPRDWVRFQKNAIRTLAWRFSSDRMVSEYVKSCYVPAAGGTTSSFVVTELPLQDPSW